MEPYVQIRKDVERLAGSRIVVFGSEAHRFILHPPVPDSEIDAFEQEHGVRLPEEYRQFLLRVGRGGAGPYYGLFDFHEMDDGFEHRRWKQGDGFVGFLARPFPYSDKWNDLAGQPAHDLADEDEAEYERQLARFEERYFAPLDGAIPICHLGCAKRQWLVVSGPEAGHVWCDDRADHEGLCPFRRDGLERVGFLTWYRDWVDRALVTPPSGNAATNDVCHGRRLTGGVRVQ